MVQIDICYNTFNTTNTRFVTERFTNTRFRTTPKHAQIQHFATQTTNNNTRLLLYLQQH